MDIEIFRGIEVEGFDETIPTPAEPAEEPDDQYLLPGGDHANEEVIHSLGAVDESGEVLRADGTPAPDKEREKWRGE